MRTLGVIVAPPDSNDLLAFLFDTNTSFHQAFGARWKEKANISSAVKH